MSTFDEQRVAAANANGTGNFDHADIVRQYYDVSTEFMSFGWSESLHFAPLASNESLEESQLRHQHDIINSLQLEPGMNVIDIGCGIGGPMRTIVREANVNVLGVNLSELQLNRAKQLNDAAQISDHVDYLNTSFMDMSAIDDNTFDRGYAIESTCHAPDKQGAFAEIFRVLKPGALFWCQEMCMTDAFNPDDPKHQEIKKELQLGIALKDIATTSEVDQALESVGFELIEGKDLDMTRGPESTPWHVPLRSAGGTRGGVIYRLPLARQAMSVGTRLAATLGIFPKGSAEVISMMDRTAFAYVAGGDSGIFTPLYCFLARKPA